MKRARIDLNFDVELFPSQQELYNVIMDNEYKYIMAAWSRQSGKTMLMKIVMIKWLVEANNNIAYVSPTLKLAKKIYKDIVKLLKPSGLIEQSNGSDLIIESKTGSILSFHSSEQADSLRGNTFTHLIIDESAFLNEGDETNNIWDNILKPTIKVRGKKILAISTPRGKQGFWYKLCMKAMAKNKGYYFSKKTIYDDGNTTPEEIEDIKNSTTEMAWRQEFMVEFLDSGLTALPGFENCFTTFTHNQSTKKWIGVDLGVKVDRTILSIIDENNYLKQVVIKGNYTTTYTRIAEIINSTKNLQGVYVETNGIGSPIYEELLKHVNKEQKSKVNEWLTTNESKSDIISNLAIEIQTNNIHFNNDDTLLYSELGTFTFTLSKTKKVIYAAKTGFHDDTVMSAAICLKAKNDLTYIPTKNRVFVIGSNNVNIN